MRPSTFLRIASVIAFLFAAGHTLGAPWTPAKGAPDSALVESMKTFHFTAMGADRTYWDFYYGFGVSISVYLLAQAVVLWQAAGLAKSDAKRVRPIMLTLLASYLVNGAVIWKFFFVAPLVFSAAICICLVLAWVSAGRQGAGVQPGA